MIRSPNFYKLYLRLRRQVLVSEKLDSTQRPIYPSAVQDQLLSKFLVHKGSELREMKNF